MKNNELSRFLTFLFSAIKEPSTLNINRVEDIDYLIKGYTNAIPDKYILDTLCQFKDYVNKDTESKTNHNWVQLIRLYSANDELSIQLFDVMFKSFLDTKNIKHPTV